jgi:hypothetical protein
MWRGRKLTKARAVGMIAALLFGMASIAGCTKIVVDGVEVYERYWEPVETQIRSRAAFDFDCHDTINLTLLGRTGRHPSAVGVRACGKTGTYTRNLFPDSDGFAQATEWALGRGRGW